MTDYSKMSDAELDAELARAEAAKPKAIDYSKLSDAELDKHLAAAEAAAKPKELGLIDSAAKKVEDLGGKVLDGPIGKGIQWAGDKIERYVDAPVRAQIGALQNGAGFVESVQAGGKQIGRDTLPTTPSGKEIMARTGLSTKSLSGAVPGMFSETGEGLALKKGGILDVSPAGVAGGFAQPSTFAFPADALISGGGKVASIGAKGAKAVASPMARAAEKLAEKGTRAVAKTGQVMTGGALKADDLINAASKLKGTELLLPEAYLGKAGKKVGAARDAIEAAGHGAVVPEAAEKLTKVKAIIEAGEKKAMKTPGSQQILDRIDEALTNPKGVSVENVDDIIRDLNNVEYTVAGNPKSIEPRWAKPLAQVRGELEPLLKSTPEGAALSSAKEPYAVLQTARGQQRAKLTNTLSMLGGLGGAALTSTSGPLGALVVAGSRAIAPRTYFQILGAMQLPKQAATALWDAYQTGKGSAIAQTAATLAEKYPEEMGRFVTTLARETDSSVSNHVTDSVGRDSAIKRRINSK